MIKTKSKISVLLLFSLCLAPMACSEEDLPDEFAELKKKKAEADAARKKKKSGGAGKAGGEAGGEVTEDDLSFSYNADGRRDPFKTYFDELQLIDPQKNTTELQRHELDKLKLIAVVVGTATPMAMVEDPSGRGHTVRIGTLIGKRFGQVKKIRRGEIVVQEEFRDFTGKRIPDEKILKLKELDGVTP